MKAFSINLFFCLFIGVFSANAQLENVIIEKYYISDANDASDTTGSVIKENSITYRVFIDMKPGCKLTKVFGNSAHELMFASDSVFYNHTAEGQSYGRKFNTSRWGEGTVALDTWITLGQTSLSKPAGKTNFGTPKKLDRNASIIGGVNNDGGSLPVASGLLNNNNILAGIPITTNDGMDTMIGIPSAWVENGFEDDFGNDSTIFGSLKPGKKFSSYNAFVTNSGVMGVNRDSNQVLIAQLTTNGEISFAINVEIIDEEGNILQYVAKNGADSMMANVYLMPSLNFPIPCGCTNPNYKEFNASFGCSKPGACVHELVLGCMDMQACNFDPNASINVSSMCCYPGLCGDRDISVVCPNLTVNEFENYSFELFPNPVEDLLTIKNANADLSKAQVRVFDTYGNLVLSEDLNENHTLDVKKLAAGIYIIHLSEAHIFSVNKFIKN